MARRAHGARYGGTAIRVACATRTARWRRTHRAHGARYGWHGERLWEPILGQCAVIAPCAGVMKQGGNLFPPRSSLAWLQVRGAFWEIDRKVQVARLGILSP